VTDVVRDRPRAAAAGDTARRTDLATILGLVLGAACIAAGIALGGSAPAFLDVPSVLIVLGGTAAVTTVSFSLAEVAGLPAVLLRAASRPTTGAEAAARQILATAETIRKRGLLTFRVDGRTARGSLLHQGIGLLVDGAGPEEAERLMAIQLAATAERHRTGADILRKAAEVAPAMGLIGTLIGLVQMLGNLSDPSTIGPAMAVALLTTFYGAILANIVLLPLAAKLERNAEHEALVGRLHIAGVASIGRGENPRLLESALNALLPPAQRVRVFD
jgi:chemotaxis protein MotA